MDLPPKLVTETRAQYEARIAALTEAEAGGSGAQTEAAAEPETPTPVKGTQVKRPVLAKPKKK